MTAAGLINILNSLPSNTEILSNSRWEDETDIESVWYNPVLKRAVLGQYVHPCNKDHNQYNLEGYKLIYNQRL